MNLLRRAYAKIPGLRQFWRALRGAGVRASSGIRSVPSRAAKRFPRLTRDNLRFEWANRTSRLPLTTPQGTAVITSTTYGPRIGRVHIAIESIAAGTERPARFILWIDDQKLRDNLPRALRRLQRRGLEIHKSPNYGVHTKYYPYVVDRPYHVLPVVTCDDDIIYPSTWLEGLVAANRETPEMIVGYRSHVMKLDENGIAPYQSWRPCRSVAPSLLNFGTAVAGQMLPASFLNRLAVLGESFREVAPKADDVWIHACAVRYGVPVRQIVAKPPVLRFVPDTQQVSLYLTNVFEGGNDEQIAAAYDDSLIAILRAEQDAQGAVPAGKS